MSTKDKKRIIIVVIFAVVAAFYIGMGIFFMHHFFPGTTLNGRKVSGCSAQRVKDDATDEIHSYQLSILTRDGNTEIIKGTDIDLEPQWDDATEKLIEKQAAFLWPVQIFYRHELTSETLVDYDEEKLQERIQTLVCMDETKQIPPENATFSEWDKDAGYTIEPCVMGTTIDRDKMSDAVEIAINGLCETLSVEEAGAYVDPKIKDDDERLAEAIDVLNQCAGARITYTIGEKTQVLDVSTFGAWFKLDKDVKPVLRGKKVKEYVSDLASKYNTCYTAKKLQTSYGKEVTIPVSHYGWKVDEEAEKEQIIETIKAGEVTTRDLNYSMTANSHEGNDYGDSYVEINLTAQHLFLYKDGQLVIDSDFVSGNVSKENGSPTGAYGITYTQKDATLRGDDYETPVAYWMPFAGNVGMHDASWRSKFGGSIYKYGGSHGCINLPVNVAKVIYENVGKNYPVLVYELPGTESTNSTNPKAAEKVEKLIEEIGTVTEDSGDAIKKAETAYDKLSATEKIYVKNYDTLTKTRKQFEKKK